MKRKDWTPTDHSRLCSEHFISGMKSNDPLNPDYIPSLFTFLSAEQRQQKISGYLKFQQAQTREGIQDRLLLSAFHGDDDSSDDTDSSDGVQADECESEAVGHDEETTTSGLPTPDEMDDAFDDANTVERNLEAEAGAIEDGGHIAPMDEENETAVKSVKTNRYFKRSPLGQLTRRFAAIIGCPRKVFDLNAVAEKLGVPKRRLYDITNVLQGIMLLEKSSKNFMRWLGPPVNPCLKSEIRALVEQETRLDKLIEDCRLHVHRLCEDSYSHGYAYLTYDDLQAIPTLSDQAVIVIKAPSQTKLEVSHPHENFRIHLRSSQGPVEVLMCHSDPVPGGGAGAAR